MAQSVIGEELQPCSYDPLTGWFRDGVLQHRHRGLRRPYRVLGTDRGVSGVLGLVGNDLSAPQPEIGFDGLNPGDRWCLCASRWAEALEAGVAPPVVLEATHARTLEWVSRSDLEAHRFGPADGAP